MNEKKINLKSSLLMLCIHFNECEMLKLIFFLYACSPPISVSSVRPTTLVTASILVFSPHCVLYIYVRMHVQFSSLSRTHLVLCFLSFMYMKMH